MPDYIALIKEKEEQQGLLDARMQTDADLLLLRKYVLKDTQSKPVRDIINITLNKPALFAANVISALGATKQQTIVESDDKQLDTHKIEEFQEAAFASADAILRRRLGQAQLGPFATAAGLALRVGRHLRGGLGHSRSHSWGSRKSSGASPST